jgi:hypothetical protein
MFAAAGHWIWCSHERDVGDRHVEAGAANVTRGGIGRASRTRRFRDVAAARSTEENWHRAELEMSEAEAEVILGPPGDHRTGPTDFHREFCRAGSRTRQ